ncbi:Putative hydrolase Mb2248c [Talaromyces islandicus]|uniref:Putative hydrolase Mb2248c n=1 Tax=Talaromyces islandicus TaxID=28573 RepID=A0A0U1LJR6_TALIS|nr:Putative hydrolase Mb2248c [Talaromyces islandicus]
MKRIVNALILLMGLGCKADSRQDPGMVYEFDNIEPSANLTWKPCFDDFSCSKLEVPLDYSNRSLGTTSIAFIKLAGKNATVESPSIVLSPGGPGNSGIDLLLTSRTLAGQIFGEQYNIVSFDPRGVNNSGLGLDCFSGNTEARLTFNRLHSTGATNVSSTSLEEQYYSSSIYGEWCNYAVENESPYGYYVTTPAVAHDLLTFIEAEAEVVGQSPSDAKLWCYGVSYGTIIGSTFASMFPDRVGRMILDGVIDAKQYYNNDWRDNVDQMDEAMEKFSSFCHSAGYEKCSFWGPTPANITARIDGIIHQLQNHPVPISGAQSRKLPTLVTYSDLKALFLDTVYTPLTKFPVMADILHQLERGNLSALAGMFDGLNSTSDARLAIQCADSYQRNKLTTIEEFKSYVKYTTSKSKYIGDIYPIYLENILCRSFRPQLPDSMVVQGPISGLDRPTFFPILFASNTIDPITPLESARKMSSRFAGSALLLQEAVGHTVVNQGGSECYFEHVQAYLRGIVPSTNITCSQDYTPFIDGPVRK